MVLSHQLLVYKNVLTFYCCFGTNPLSKAIGSTNNILNLAKKRKPSIKVVFSILIPPVSDIEEVLSVGAFYLSNPSSKLTVIDPDTILPILHQSNVDCLLVNNVTPRQCRLLLDS